jgi:predicted amidohydrolase
LRISNNAADLFAEIWRDLSENHEATEGAIAEQAAEPRERTLGFSRRLIQSRLALDDQVKGLDDLQKFIRGDGDPSGIWMRRLLVAQGIDEWYEGVGTLALDDQLFSLEHLRAQYLLGSAGRFNLVPALGQVIPKLPASGRRSDPDFAAGMPLGTDKTRPLYETFKWLVVIPETVPATDPDDCLNGIDERHVKLTYRIVPTVPRRARGFPAGNLMVGFAPLALDADDVDLVVSLDDGRGWYDAFPRDLGAQAGEALRSLSEAGAHIVIFPEATMHPSAHAPLRDAISRHGKASELELVVAGTTSREAEGGMPRNEAVIYDARGVEIGRQSKLHRWNLNSDQRRQLGVVSHLSDDELLYERIRPGDEVVVFELGELGRFCVLICEDLSRSEPGRFLRANLALDWVFTPILDRSIEEHRWMHSFGKAAARDGRCRVAVSNSLALTHRSNAARLLPPLSECGAALCVDWRHDREAAGERAAGDESDVRYFLWKVKLADAAPWAAINWDVEAWAPTSVSTSR